MPIEFTVSDQVVARFPQLTVHAMRIENLARAAGALDTTALLNAAAQTGPAADPISDHPVLKDWRQTYGNMNVKPSKYRSSIEALLRRAAKGDVTATGIPSVDLYNACSLAACAPMGAYDAARLPDSPLELRLARPEQDRFDPLGAEPSAFPLTDALVVYATGSTVLCWGFNVRDCRSTALTGMTETAVFFSEALTPDQFTRSQLALHLLSDHLSAAGATCSPVQHTGAAATLML